MSSPLRHAALILLSLPLLSTAVAAESYEQLLSRLEAGEASPAAGSVVIEALRRAPSLPEARRVYALYGELVTSREQQLTLYRELALLEELAGNFQGALVFYERILAIDPEDGEVRLRAAAAALETGEYERSRRHSEYVIDSARDGAAQRRGALYLALSYYHLDNQAEGLPLFRSLTRGESRGTVESTTLSLALLAARSWGAAEYAEELEAKLRRLYPESLDRLALRAGSAVSLSPRPSLLLPASPWDAALLPAADPTEASELRAEELREREPQEQEPQQQATPTPEVQRSEPASEEQLVVGIQTGSFSDRGNAAVMRDEILEEGIDAELREVELDGRQYYRVVVPTAGPVPAEDAQELVVRLKELGVEGFLLFRE